MRRTGPIVRRVPALADSGFLLQHSIVMALVATLLLLGELPVRAQVHPGFVSISTAAGWGNDDLREWDATVDSMIRSGELVVRASYDDRLLPTRTHQRLSQHHMGVPVFGGDVSRQFQSGVTVSIIGGLYDQIGIDVVPTLDLDQAAEAIREVSGVSPAQGVADLVVLPTLAGKYVLAYRAMTPDAWTHFVDAHTGVLVMSVDERKTQGELGRGTGALGDIKKVSALRAAGTFRAHDQLRPAEILTLDTHGVARSLERFEVGAAFPSDIAADSDNEWDSAGVVDTHVHMGWTYDYLFKRHQWSGWDGRNTRIYGAVGDYRVLPNSAVFLRPPFGPEGGGLVEFGATSAGVPIATLDTVAHELMHAVTYFAVSRRRGEGLNSRLIPDGLGPETVVFNGEVFPCDRTVLRLSNGQDAPFFCVNGRYALASNHGGAINEAFADVIGTSVEFFFQDEGSGPLRADYRIGEDVAGFGPIRSLSNPRALRIKGSDLVFPDHMSRRIRFMLVIAGGGLVAVRFVLLDGTVFPVSSLDSGGVHWNATILGHAFYRAIRGGQNFNSGQAVGGVGEGNREQIEQVFFRAMTEIMPSGADMPMAAAAIWQSALDLFGFGSPAAIAIDEALRSVGL